MPIWTFLCLRQQTIVKSVSRPCKREMMASSSSLSSRPPLWQQCGKEIEVSCLAAITTMAGSCQLESLCSSWKYTAPQILSSLVISTFLQFGQLSTHLNHFSEIKFSKKEKWQKAYIGNISGYVVIYQACTKTWPRKVGQKIGSGLSRTVSASLLTCQMIYLGFVCKSCPFLL